MASGNIGLPFATAVRQSNELDVMVLEVSSFQLETIDAFRPHVSVWLNFSPNHLDRYRDMDEYRTAKLRIFLNQTADDYAVVNARENLPSIAARHITFSAYVPDADFTLRDGIIHYRNEPVLDQRETSSRSSQRRKSHGRDGRRPRPRPGLRKNGGAVRRIHRPGPPMRVRA